MVDVFKDFLVVVVEFVKVEKKKEKKIVFVKVEFKVGEVEVIGIEDFMKVDFCVVEVLEVVMVEGLDKLF